MAASFETHHGACHRARIRATRWRCSHGWTQLRSSRGWGLRPSWWGARHAGKCT